MREETIRVTGIRELLYACDLADKQTKKLVRDDLRKIAEPVKRDAARRFGPISEKTASHFGISVRKTGVVSVEQRLRKTTGKHPEFGALQMKKALLPALYSKEPEVALRLETAIFEIANRLGEP